MLASILFYLLGAALLSAGLCTLGVIITFLAQGPTLALELLRSWIIDFNGILVGGAGYGLLFFVRRKGAIVLAQLNNMIDISADHVPSILRLHDRTTSWFWTNLISIPLTIIGGIILWNCGFPLEGFARIYLTVCVISLYYVASSTLAFFLYSLAFFNFLDEQSQQGCYTRLKPRQANDMDLEVIDSFFIMGATVGILALYLGFRGTLTANFVGDSYLFRNLLILPVFLYLPAALCYSFYPRYVLRKILERDVCLKIEEFEKGCATLSNSNYKESLELKKLVFELKEKMLADHRQLPLLGFKDAPSLTISILLVIQFILQKDSLVKDFVGGLLK